MLRILSVAGDAGGTDAIAPVLAALAASPNTDVQVVAGPFAALSLRRAKVAATAVDGALPRFVAQAWIEESQPDLLLVGTSWGRARIEPAFVTAARSVGCPTLTVLDYWSNYRARFADETGALSNLTDTIAVMDEQAREEAIADGLPADRLVVTGAPHYEHLLTITDRIRGERIRDRYKIGANDRLVLFVSQPLEALYGSALGYTEHDVLDLVSAAVPSLMPPAGGRTVFAVRRHPREEPTDYSHTIIDASGGDSLDWILAADLVVGMNSAVLLQAALIGRPTVSVQPGRQDNDLLPSNRMGLSTPVYDRTAVGEMMRKTLAGTVPRATGAREALERLAGGATARVVALVRTMAAGRYAEVPG
ncbi:MAG: hypothetical protein ABI647_07955 [Gemmatimonadota bacterium]